MFMLSEVVDRKPDVTNGRPARAPCGILCGAEVCHLLPALSEPDQFVYSKLCKKVVLKNFTIAICLDKSNSFLALQLDHGSRITR